MASLTRYRWSRLPRRVLPTVVAVLVLAPLIQLLGVLLDPGNTMAAYTRSVNNTEDVPTGGPVMMTSAQSSGHLSQLPGSQDFFQTSLRELQHLEAPLTADQITVIGKARAHPGFLTIGIPTVYRKSAGSVYLTHTIDSIIEQTTDSEKENTTVLVFAADRQKSQREKVIATVRTKFGVHLTSGFIQIMQVSPDSYPQLEGLKRNFNDNPDRVKWRAKQVLDFAFMFHHGSNLSEYYVQIEDDVLSTKHFVSDIKSHIEKVGKSDPHWVMIDFSELGFIGKLFRSSDLGRFSRFLWLFYQEMPVDWLLTFFHQLLAQKKKILRKPTLFQHMGEYSSFSGKGKNKLKDRFYGGGKPEKIEVVKQILGKNPPAYVCSTIEHYKDHIPMNAYNDATDNFFWGKKPKESDTFTVVFKIPRKLTKLYIETGHSQQQNDFIREGLVQVSPAGNDKCVCTNFQTIGSFAHGKFVGEDLKGIIKFPVKCIQIVISKAQEEWVIIREIRPNDF